MPLHDRDPVFGSPNAEDGTARFDRIAGEVRGMMMKHLADGAQVLNRPIGSKVLTPTERKEDYNLLYKGNVEKLSEALTQFIGQAQNNPIKGARDWSDWIIENEKEKS